MENQTKPEPYLIVEAFADNGSHSHWKMIDTRTGANLWSEFPEEDAALGHPVEPELQRIRSEVERLREVAQVACDALKICRGYVKAAKEMESNAVAWGRHNERLFDINSALSKLSENGITPTP
jgi:hypothetical protein